MSPRPGTPSSPPSPSIFAPLRVVTMTGSTQDDLRADLTGSAAASWPHFSALHALGQSAGRGRSGNTWTTPPTGALTVSVVLRPLVPADRLAWLPLLAGLAVRDALAPLVDARDWQLRTKWPNDVIAVPAGPASAPADVELRVGALGRNGGRRLRRGLPSGGGGLLRRVVVWRPGHACARICSALRCVAPGGVVGTRCRTRRTVRREQT